MEPLSLLVGAAILAVGLLAGEIHGRVAARRQRPEKPREPICGCKHHLANHDRKTGECHAKWLRTREEYESGRVRQWEERVGCPCRQYVGPEPISSVWVPPTAVESGGR